MMGIRLYWWREKRKNGLENYGDLLSKYLVEKISNKKVISIKHPLKGFHKYFFKHYICIGSIISSASKKSIVWGSGIIKKNDNIRNAKFLAVRGPETRAKILEKGFECAEVYGDPAILLPDYYSPKIKKIYELGIVPHYVDYDRVVEVFSNEKNIKIINLLTTDIEKTTDEILECEKIISSSLHGLILPHAYGIPAIWIKFSDKLSGDNIKFYDYYKSMDIDFNAESLIDLTNTSFQNLNRLFEVNKLFLLPKESILNSRKKALINSCPFNDA
ncbi:polysaccharide pyruvyl transferase [Mariniflexile fucanivorans]|uniref:Polysaccharide pyruvyl transferase n=1 Tax=Mariniflexile fucanivorans TaxID=264023 RepID=A0A4R1RDH0_9FLAO|nr:polysaccharide pyruvyl transferase family protein [Mariniflexile fucanivorans]TCL63883.1 polysaccharide pyruvyl transferase [Mariniflexile fucanivorans]